MLALGFIKPSRAGETCEAFLTRILPFLWVLACASPDLTAADGTAILQDAFHEASVVEGGLCLQKTTI